MRNHHKQDNMKVGGSSQIFTSYGYYAKVLKLYAIIVVGLLLKSPKTTFSFLELQCAFFVGMSLLFVGIVHKRISEFSFRAFFHFRALQSPQPGC